MDSKPGIAASSIRSSRIKTQPMLLSLFLGLSLGGAPGAQAHELFTAFIQHRVAMALGAKHVDVTVQLTFFEEQSARERAHMDTNRDGRLSRAEIDAYLQKLEPALAEAVRLRVGGQPTALTALRAPELDLLGQNRVGRGHHRLTLSYFAPAPAALAQLAELIVDDRLWPGVRALGTVQAEGKDGCRLEAVPASDPVFPPANAAEARSFTARVLSLPKSPTGKAGRNPSPPRPPKRPPNRP